MLARPEAPVTLHADQEHSGIRFAIFASLFLAYVIGFQIVAWLIEALAPESLLDYTTFLSCVGAVPFALLIIWGLEKVLKRYWHSGLSLELDDVGLTVRDTRDKSAAAADAPAIRWSDNLSQLNWYFRLSGYPRGGRERRVPAKWLCLATELQQEGARLGVFTFMPPEQAEAWIEKPGLGFQRINQTELHETTLRSRVGPPTRPVIPNRLLQSKEGRYWLAERRRWEYGVELTPEDFATLMERVRDVIRRQAAHETPTGTAGSDLYGEGVHP